MIALAVVLLAGVQDDKPKNEAEELFKAMSEKIVKASTLSVKLEGKIESSLEEEDNELNGRIHLKKGNKARIEIETLRKGRERKLMLVSDGKRVKGEKFFERGATIETPQKLNELISGSMPRAPVFYLTFFPVAGGPNGEEPKAEEIFKTSDYKMGAKKRVGDRDAQVVEYTLEIVGEENKVAVQVWIDVETKLPMKRSFKVVSASREIEIDETFAELKVDGTIEDQTFELKD
jgi:outer membrane lipoprotein-sorting protein